ncbi:MAG TPA: RsmB/NOP family class I SAM-dependent RNA methyltransferase [Alphaproteobacteria bacterium]|nr:RsmB/NOP family class I SAM-dependent RNA methyltransferase [Alphaproteobacteria bacterium]
MNPSARLQATLELLTEIDSVLRPADALVSAYFRARRYIGSKDRAAVSTMTYDILRHRARLDWWLKKADGLPTARSWLLAYLALVNEMRLKDIGEMFSGGKYAPEKLEEFERVILRQLETHTIEHPDMPEEVKTECPDWAAIPLKERFGKNFSKEMRALLKAAPLDLRVNPLKTTRDAILDELKTLAIKAEACTLSEFGIRVFERPSLNALPMLKNGSVEIQDEGSQLVALLVDAKPGQRVVDFCAGAGGKTLAIAAQMKNKGKIIACDVLAKRLERSTERFRRAGLHNIEVKPLKSERDPWVKKHKGDFDRVLVDAPCSGTGTWRRNPDGRWRSLGPGLEKLLPLQAEILDSAARLVKSGGRLIYATCSMLPEENEKQVEAFLASHPDFKLVPYKAIWAEGVSAQEECLSLTPAQHGTDGFFAAVMENTAAPKPPKEVREGVEPASQETA